MPNNISLDDAIAMTSRYRSERDNILREEYQNQNILLTCETFEKAAFEELISQPGCDLVRIYFGMTEDLQVRAIIVGANSADEDLLPESSTDPTAQIVEEGMPCPTSCPPPSPLNED